MRAAKPTRDETGLSGSGPNRWIWPFELLDQLGTGGMGVVYRARYVVNNREVAVKILPAEVTDKIALARFERETEVLKDLRHPNIVRSFGGVCEDKCRFYAMELVPGGSLERVIEQRGRLPWEQVVEYGLQMCAALECSHKHGIIHRDVKPGNFLIGANGQLKLSDFGLASVAAQRKITQPGKTAGTFLYMAPEQIKGGEISGRTDLYALGCVLFEMLTGKPPFAAETPAATLDRHCRQKPPRVSEIALDCPASLDRLVDRLLEKVPSRRPESAAEVARELRAVSQTVTVVPSRRTGATQTTVSSRPVVAPTRRDTAPPESDTLLTGSFRSSASTRTLVAVAAAAILLTAAVTTPAWKTQREISRRWEELAIQSAASPNFIVRNQGLRMLAQMADTSERARDTLAEALRSDDSAIRASAANAAGAAGASARSLLAELHIVQRDDPDDDARNAATAAVMKIDQSPEPKKNRWPVIVTLLIAIVGAVAGYFWINRSGKSSAELQTS